MGPGRALPATSPPEWRSLSSMFPRGTLRCMPMSRGNQVEPRPNPTCTKGAGWKAGSGEGGGLDCCLFPLASPGVITFYIPIALIQDNLAFICTLADGLQPSHLPPLGVHAKMLMIWFSFFGMDRAWGQRFAWNHQELPSSSSDSGLWAPNPGGSVIRGGGRRGMNKEWPGRQAHVAAPEAPPLGQGL